MQSQRPLLRKPKSVASLRRDSEVTGGMGQGSLDGVGIGGGPGVRGHPRTAPRGGERSGSDRGAALSVTNP